LCACRLRPHLLPMHPLRVTFWPAPTLDECKDISATVGECFTGIPVASALHQRSTQGTEGVTPHRTLSDPSSGGGSPQPATLCVCSAPSAYSRRRHAVMGRGNPRARRASEAPHMPCSLPPSRGHTPYHLRRLVRCGGIRSRYRASRRKVTVRAAKSGRSATYPASHQCSACGLL